MDDAKQKIILAVGMLLSFVGCSLTVPKGTVPLHDDVVSSSAPSPHVTVAPPRPAVVTHDPFLAAVAAKPQSDPFLEVVLTGFVKTETDQEKISQPENAPENVLENISVDPDTAGAEMAEQEPIVQEPTVELIKTEPKTELTQEAELEPETEPVTDEEQEAILTKDYWVKNVVLDRWIENGMKDPFPNRNASDHKRQAEINRLNMSEKEARKAKNTNAEYLTGLPSTWRWFHPEMEKLSSIPSELRGNPEVFLRNEEYQGKNHAMLRANAAILMGRDGDPLMEKELIAIVKNKDFRVELRCAAAETLGKLRTVSADTLLPLLEPSKEKEIEITNPQTGLTSKKFEAGTPALWLELLTAIADRIEPWEHPCFMEPFSAQKFEMRWENAKIWRRHSPPKKFDGTPAGGSQYQLPDAFLEYARQEPASQIRIENIRTLGLWKTPDIFKLVSSDLNREALVRNAALETLADAGCQEAIPLIKQRLTDTVPQNRAKAVEALRKLGCLEDVFRMVDDSDPNVRAEVAKAFADRCSPQTVALAKRCINDQYEKVRQATLDAVSGWLLEESGLILLEGAKCEASHKIRTQAAFILARYGIENKNFDPAEPPKNQVKQYDELVRRFHTTIPSSEYRSENINQEIKPAFAVDPDDPVVADVRRCLSDWRKPHQSPAERQTIQLRLMDLGDHLTPSLDYLYEIERRKIPESLDPVIAEVNPVFEMIVKLRSEDVSERRQAASELDRIATIRNLGKLAVRRISDQAGYQTDVLVLTSLLETLKKADAEPAKRFSVTLSESESPELRCLACGMFKEKGDSSDLPLLINLLRDSNRNVFRSSLEAMTAILRNENIGAEEAMRTEMIEILGNRLQQNDIRQQIEIAAALHRLGEPTGAETLRRLVFSPDTRTKCYVAETIAELGDKNFVPLLLALLDDRNGSVRTAALNNLPKLAGEDIEMLDFGKSYSAESSISQQKVARWKKWAASLQQNPVQ